MLLLIMLITIVSILILFYLILYEFGSIVNGDTLKYINRKGALVTLTSQNTYKLLHIIAFICLLAVVVAIGICINSYYKNYYKVGIPGDKGIKGRDGDDGKDGTCGFKCGQKVCYSELKDHIDKIFKEHSGMSEKINNFYFLNKINKICHSNSYQQIMRKEHPNKPNEKKLINYLKGIIGEWVKIILNNSNGKKFLLSTNLTENLWEKDSPFDEIKKYDIWGWTSTNTLTKQIVKKQCSFKQDLPEADNPPLKIIKTNNYQYKYDSETSKDKFGPEDCPYDQMGIDKSNPNKRKYCIYKNRRNPNDVIYKKVFKTKKVGKPRGLSLYHPKSMKDSNNIDFYPVGSVWRGRTSIVQPKTLDRKPIGARLSKDGETNIGPIKETILISGDVTAPKDYTKVWSSKDGDQTNEKNEFQPSSKNATIWRPIPKDGYVCLGDVVMEGSEKPDSDYVRCIPENCVEDVSNAKPHGDLIWRSNEMNVEYFNKDGPLRTTKPTPVSIYSTGNSNATEERNNRPGLIFDDDGGYNLFKSTASVSAKPTHRSLKIKGTCLYNPRPESLYKKFNDSGFGLTGGTKRAEKYSVFLEYGKPPIGIIRNKSRINSPSGKEKAYYIKDSRGGLCKGNSYFLKTYSKKTKNFDDSIVIKNEKELMHTDLSFKTEPGHVWKIIPVKDSLGRVIKNKKDEIEVYCISLYDFDNKENRYFKQEYDENGISHESLTLSPVTWWFKSIVGDLVPNNFNTC